MAGLRHTLAAQIDADVTKMLADLASYFTLQQAGRDVDLRSLAVDYLIAKLVGLDAQMAAALRYRRDMESNLATDKTLVQLDPLAGG